MRFSHFKSQLTRVHWILPLPEACLSTSDIRCASSSLRIRVRVWDRIIRGTRGAIKKTPIYSIPVRQVPCTRICCVQHLHLSNKLRPPVCVNVLKSMRVTQRNTRNSHMEETRIRATRRTTRSTQFGDKKKLVVRRRTEKNGRYKSNSLRKIGCLNNRERTRVTATLLYIEHAQQHRRTFANVRVFCMSL